MSELDIFVLPSLTENFPNTLVEAMFAGLPCIAFRIGGVPEVLGETGITLEPKDTENLAKELEKLIETPSLRKKFADASKERALKEFNLTVNCKKLEDFFRRTISASR